jgi:hypothetical protein
MIGQNFADHLLSLIEMTAGRRRVDLVHGGVGIRKRRRHHRDRERQARGKGCSS